MMMRFLLLLWSILGFLPMASAQTLLEPDKDDPYISYFDGNEDDYVVNSVSVFTPNAPKITMMGGGIEHDEAMKWFLEQAYGGDVLVLRASSGSDGYQKYLYEELGVDVDSVETLVIYTIEAAQHPYVIQQIQNAEAIWLAGGDQWDYLSIWGDNMKRALNNHIAQGKTIGGTSAGMAVLGEWYYTAERGSVISEEALEDPYHPLVTLGTGFLKIPVLENVITDQHYANREHQGRHSAFMARILQEKTAAMSSLIEIQSQLASLFNASDNSALAASMAAPVVYGIACDEYTAINIDSSTGMAYVFGSMPEYPDGVYFIQSKAACIDVKKDTSEASFLPEVCEEGIPLTWNSNQQALHVYRIRGTDGNNGSTNYFNLNDWRDSAGGEWLYWYIEDGEWFETKGEAPSDVQC